MSKQCPKCGCIAEDGAKFCDECGAPLETVKNQPVVDLYQQNEPQIDMYSIGSTESSGQVAPEIIPNVVTESMTSTPKKKKNTLGVVSLIFGICSIVTMGACFFPEIIAIVCGVRSKDELGNRTKLGNAGMICGIIGAGLIILLLLI